MSAGAFAPGAERVALAESAARFLRERCARTTPLPHGTGPDRLRWREFAGLGWLGMVVAERDGGLALPPSFASVLFEALAPAAIIEPLASQLALGGALLAAAAPSGPRDAALSRWIAGDSFVALAHHEAPAAPYYDTPIATTATMAADGTVHLRGSKSQVIDGGLADTLLVSARRRDSGSCCVLLCDVRAPGLDIRHGPTLDGRNLATIAFDDVAVPASALLEFANAPQLAIEQSLATFALLLSAENVGAMRALIGMTHDYLGQREQFGRKLIDFQVLQHRLVDMLLALTRAESLLELARTGIDAHGASGAQVAIAAAKAATGEWGLAVAEHAVQLHGAIGVTAELMCGALMRRIAANAVLGGTTSEHRRRFAERPFPAA